LSRLAASGRHPIGTLQWLRAELKGRQRTRSTIFDIDRTVFTRPDGHVYAFHYGGRTELQFNLGSEWFGNNLYLRHGVAFSFELSQTLPSVTDLLPSVARFNQFMRLCPMHTPIYTCG